jgi:hypothetical protein
MYPLFSLEKRDTASSTLGYHARLLTTLFQDGLNRRNLSCDHLP